MKVLKRVWLLIELTFVELAKVQDLNLVQVKANVVAVVEQDSKQ